MAHQPTDTAKGDRRRAPVNGGGPARSINPYMASSTSRAFSHIQVVQKRPDATEPEHEHISEPTFSKPSLSQEFNSPVRVNPLLEHSHAFPSILSSNALARNSQGATFAAKARAAELQAARAKQELKEKAGHQPSLQPPAHEIMTFKKANKKCWKPLNLSDIPDMVEESASEQIDDSNEEDYGSSSFQEHVGSFVVEPRPINSQTPTFAELLKEKEEEKKFALERSMSNKAPRSHNDIKWDFNLPTMPKADRLKIEQDRALTTFSFNPVKVLSNPAPEWKYEARALEQKQARNLAVLQAELEAQSNTKTALFDAEKSDGGDPTSQLTSRRSSTQEGYQSSPIDSEGENYTFTSSTTLLQPLRDILNEQPRALPGLIRPNAPRVYPAVKGTTSSNSQMQYQNPLPTLTSHFDPTIQRPTIAINRGTSANFDSIASRNPPGLSGPADSIEVLGTHKNKPVGNFHTEADSSNKLDSTFFRHPSGYYRPSNPMNSFSYYDDRAAPPGFVGATTGVIGDRGRIGQQSLSHANLTNDRIGSATQYTNKSFENEHPRDFQQPSDANLYDSGLAPATMTGLHDPFYDANEIFGHDLAPGSKGVEEQGFHDQMHYMRKEMSNKGASITTPSILEVPFLSNRVVSSYQRSKQAREAEFEREQTEGSKWWDTDTRFDPYLRSHISSFMTKAAKQDHVIRNQKIADMIALRSANFSDDAADCDSQKVEHTKAREDAADLLLPVLANLRMHVNHRDYFSKHGEVPQWCLDQSENGKKSFFGEDWGAPPLRVGRDPRYRPVQHDGRNTIFDDFGGRWAGAQEHYSSWH